MGAKGSTATLQADALQKEEEEAAQRGGCSSKPAAYEPCVGAIRRLTVKHFNDLNDVTIAEVPEEQQISVLVDKLSRQLGIPERWLALSSGDLRLPGCPKPLHPPPLSLSLCLGSSNASGASTDPRPRP